MAVNTPEHSVRIPYFHASVPDHVNDLRKQAENPQSPRVRNGENAVPMQSVAERGKPRRRRGVVYESQLGSEQEGQELPERLMTAQQVIEILKLPQSTVWTWLANGRLREWGRLWLAEPGGRSRPLVSLSEAESLKNERSPMGRLPQRRTQRRKGSKPQD
jgi:hypothetical protein